MNGSDHLHVLLVEDDAGIGRMIRRGFNGEPITLNWLRTGTPVLRSLKTDHYDAIILDLMLPDMDGFDLCRDIRAQGNNTPICMLTARDALEDKLEGFDIGADDYLTKPFELAELVARLRAMVRRDQQELSQSRVEHGSLLIDLLAREASVGEHTLDLTRREFDVLHYLARNAQQVVTRERLLQVAWGSEREVTLNTVDVYIGYLRRKLSDHPRAPQIRTVRGIGFKLQDGV